MRTDVVGIQHYAGLVGAGEFVVLRRQPNNPYDANAVQVGTRFLYCCLTYRSSTRLVHKLATSLAPSLAVSLPSWTPTC